ncbi:hypothetical protein MaudMau93_004185 [Microsporum audouinii]
MTLHIPPRMSSVSHQYQYQHQHYRQENCPGIIERAFDPYATTSSPGLAAWREHNGEGFKDTESAGSGTRPGSRPGLVQRAESCASDLTGGYSINRTGRLDEESDGEVPVKEHKVRPRLSSPFLRHSSKKVPLSNSKQEALRPSDSPSTSRPFNRSQNSSTTQLYNTNTSPSQGLTLRDYHAVGSRSTTDLPTDHDPGLTVQQGKKQKHRPPMIDLSKLFPRQRKVSGPCLQSPDQMTSPPSVRSNESDVTVYKTHKFDRAQRALNRLTKSPNPKRPSTMQSEYRQNGELLPVQEPLDRYQPSSPLQDLFKHQKDQNHQPQHQEKVKEKQAESPGERLTSQKYEGWSDPNSNRKKVSSAWFDGSDSQLGNDDEGIRPGDEVEIMYGQLLSRDQQPRTRNRRSMSLPSRQPSVQSGKIGYTGLGLPNASHGTPQKPKSSAGPVKSASSNSSSSQLTDSTEPVRKPTKDKPKIRKKSSRAILNSSNLNESSVLCLSSSEDESEDEPSGHTRLRDSINTIDEGFQICTAKTATATSRPSIKRVRSSSKKRVARGVASTARSQNGDSSRPSSLHPSTASVTESNCSSTPALPEWLPASPPKLPRIQTQFSPVDSQLSQPGNRRSRVIAVTRQEEYLLELIRRNKGVTPQPFSPDGSASTHTREWAKAVAVQLNRRSNSSYSSDTSFLRLSPALPPTPHQKKVPRSIPTPTTAGDAASARSVPQSAFSDTSFHTGLQSPPLPKISLTNSTVSFPSPPSGQSSPFTPPAIPLKHRRHSSRLSHAPSMPSVRESLRNRANTSALYDDNDEVEKDIQTNPDLPIWALGWNSDATGVAIVH